MMAEKTIRRVHSNAEKRTEIKNLHIAVDKPISYPSTWFLEHPNKNPPILIPDDKDATLRDLYNTVLKQFPTGRLDVRIAVSYLHKTFDTSEELLSADWISFNYTIGLKGAKIKLSNLVEFQPSETPPSLYTGDSDPTPGDLLKPMIAICCCYRVLNAAREDYRQKLIENMDKFLNGIAGPSISIGTAAPQYGSWLTYKPYCQIMAAIDMFLNEFPDNMYSQARIGTIASRFKDCTTLVDTHTIISTLGIDIIDLSEWIWTSRLADQYAQVVKVGEEVDNPRSYFMYFMELGLSEKSPYSTTVNKDLHLFYHTVGVSIGLERSRNSRFLPGAEVLNVISNAVVLNYVLGTYSQFGEQFSATGEPIDIEHEGMEDSVLEGSRTPDNANPAEWLGYIQSCGGKIPSFIKRKATSQWQLYPSSRENSTGLYLYNLSRTYQSEVSEET